MMAFRDVTEHKLLQRQLEFADRFSLLGTMAAGVAHEVNNPLARRVVFLSGGAVTAKVATFLLAVPNLRIPKPFEELNCRHPLMRIVVEADDRVADSPRALLRRDGAVETCD